MYLYIQTCLSKGSGAAGYAVREQDPPTSARHFLSPSPKDVGAQGPFAQQLPLEQHRQHFVRRKEGFKASATQPLTRRGISKPRGATPWPKPGLVHVEPLPAPSQHGLGERLKPLRRGEVTSASLLFLWNKGPAVPPNACSVFLFPEKRLESTWGQAWRRIGGPPGVAAHSRSFPGTNISFLEAFPQLRLKHVGWIRASRASANFLLLALR